MPIRVWDYRRELEQERASVDAAIHRVLESGWLILGQEVTGLENEFAAYCGATFGVGVNSGTDALFLGLKALGVGPGDEVITVSNTAVPTVSAIASTGATARFVDIDEATYLMDTSALEAAITPRTKCLLPVHLFGQCVDMAAVNALAKQHGITVLEDCAQSHGARQGNAMAGSMSDLAAFSFYPTKILGGYGDGGMVIGSDEELDQSLRRLRFYGMKKQYYAEEHGYNSRLDELHAAILRERLKLLDDFLDRRRAIAARYDDWLDGSGLTLPVTAPGNQHAYYLYVARHPERDRILEQLGERDIQLNVSYRWPIHTMRGYAELGYSEGDFPVTERVAHEIFSLPMYPGLDEADQRRVCDALIDIVGSL